MSLSPIVDQRYRLAPADLAGRPRQVMVRQVGMQGLDELTPLLYFEGVARPLALDYDQRVAMSRIARSYRIADWVGAALVLRPTRTQGRDTILLYDLEERLLASNPPLRERWEAGRAPLQRLLGRGLVVLLIVALAFGAVWLVERLPDLTALGEIFAR